MAAGGFDARTVAEIYVDLGCRYGTGTLVAPGLVLAALHIVRDPVSAEGRCQIRAGAGLTAPTWHDAVSVWCDPQLDTVLLAPRSAEPFLPRGSFTLLRFGLRPQRDVSCRIVGFPAATDRPDLALNDALDVAGRIRPLAFVREGLIGVSVDGAAPLDPTLWRGLSGAGVISGRTLIGMVLKTAPQFGARMLKALPLERLLADSSWRTHVESARGRALDAEIDGPEALHDGDARLPLDQELRERLERRRDACVTSGVPFRTFHKLKALFEMPGEFVASCFEDAGPATATEVNNWLDRSIREQTQHEPSLSGGLQPIDADASLAGARVIAEREAAAIVDERHLLLALLSERETGTISTLIRDLGEERFRAIEQAAMRHRPRRIVLEKSAPPPLKEG